MKTNTTWLYRIIATLIGSALSGYLYSTIVNTIGLDWMSSSNHVMDVRFLLVSMVIGAILGYLYLYPKFSRFKELTDEEVGGVFFGSLIGLFASALFCVPLLLMPSPFNHLLGFFTTVGITYLTATTFGKRNNIVSKALEQLKPHNMPMRITPVPLGDHDDAPIERNELHGLSSEDGVYKAILLDTSVIIDGRILDISRTGFLNARLLVPRFVLNELQYIADSPDPIRRKRGRRGLEVLRALQTDCPLPFEIQDIDVSEVKEVDSKLVALARHLNVPIMTNDYNLNKVAGLQGVVALNINDLANSVKAAYLPGEKLRVKVIQGGREQGQGIGYLEDGTMVVVENGTSYMDTQLSVEVTKVLQTSAGKMVFAKLPDGL